MFVYVCFCYHGNVVLGRSICTVKLEAGWIVQDVFTVSVGNLPPRCTAVVKITYAAELVVDGDHIRFRVPGSVAPWTRKSALDSQTQAAVETVRVDGRGDEVSVQVAVEMPFEIRAITSPSHRLRIKVIPTVTVAVTELFVLRSLPKSIRI